MCVCVEPASERERGGRGMEGWIVYTYRRLVCVCVCYKERGGGEWEGHRIVDDCSIVSGKGGFTWRQEKVGGAYTMLNGFVMRDAKLIELKSLLFHGYCGGGDCCVRCVVS